MGVQTYETYVTKGLPWYKMLSKILFSRVGLFLLVIGYSVGGAQILMILEKEREDGQEAAKIQSVIEINAAQQFLQDKFWEYGTNEVKYNYTQPQFEEAVHLDLIAMENYVLSQIGNNKYDTTTDFDRQFSFGKAFLFTLTTVTTIGYGHIQPQTQNGKLFCIIYALVGIPLMLMFLAQIGTMMAFTFRWFYSRLLCRWCRARRRDSELLPEMDRGPQSISKDDIGKERYMPTDLVQIPIMVNLMLIFFFIFIGAIVFYLYEGPVWNGGDGSWDMPTSAYFCLVTLTTIGFGDLYPLRSYTEYDQNITGILMMCFSTLYIIFGMALISMCLSLMREQIVEKVGYVMSFLSGDEEKQEVVKLSKEGRVAITPAFKINNETEKKNPLTIEQERMIPAHIFDDVEMGIAEEDEEEERGEDEEERSEDEEERSEDEKESDEEEEEKPKLGTANEAYEV